MTFFASVFRLVLVLTFAVAATVTLAACTPAQTTGVQSGPATTSATATPAPAGTALATQPGLQGGVARVSIAATDGAAWGYNPNFLEIPAGQEVTLTLLNHGVIDHDIEFADMPAEDVQAVTDAHANTDAHTPTDTDHHAESVVAAHAKAGSTAAVTFTPVKPGSYEFICTLPGHKQAGMVGRMIVHAATTDAAGSGAAPSGGMSGTH